MNDELNIPHSINHYGADGLPADTGFVSEDVFLARVDNIAALAIWKMLVQVLIQEFQLKKKWLSC